MDPITAILVNLIILLVSTGASMLIKSMQGQDKKQVPGVRGTRQVGGTNPMAFIVGTYGTAGQFEYGGEWGNDGETPNAFRSEVYSYCDLPCEGLSGRFIAGALVTLDSVAHPELGYPVLEYRVSGKDHLWFRDHTGMQTAADSLLLAKFGADPERPWKSDMVFPGVAYSVVTSLWNRELFAGAIPEPMFEDRGIWFYDVRRDSTAGGAGSHRLNDPSTWAWTDNPIVIIYGILLGIKYQGEWIWGGQDIEQHHLPYASWAAQMDKCDALVSIPGGGTEKRFRCGLEISVDSEPQAIIGEILKACEGKISENGGIYKVLVGEPDAPVVSVTPSDIVVSDPQTFDPFPGLENLFNEMRSDYPEPGEAWEMKEAPPRLRSDLVAKDDGRRLPFSTSYKAAPFGHQVQRLMYAAIEETRRFGRLVKTHPPEFWEYEPLDTYLLTDPQDGFVNKQFLITAMDDLPNGNQVVGAQEVDPADYTPPPGFELPWDIVPLQIARPAPQEVSGFYVEPAIANDSQGRPRRPAIDAFWSAASVTVDVRAVRITVRVDDGGPLGSGELAWEGEAPVPITGSARLAENLVGDSDYVVQIEYAPHSGRATVASSWLAVTTPDVKLTSLDIELDDIANEIAEQAAGLEDWTRHNTRETIEEKRKAILLNVAGAVGGYNDRQVIRREASSQSLANKAEWTEDILVATGPGSAIVARIEELRTEVFDPVSGLPATNTIVNLLSAEVSTQGGQISAINNSILSLNSTVGGISADGLLRVFTSATPSGALARIALSVSATSGGAPSTAAMYLDAMSDGKSRILMVADQISFTNGSALENPFVFEGGVLTMRATRVQTITAGVLQSPDGKFVVNLGAKRISIST